MVCFKKYYYLNNYPSKDKFSNSSSFDFLCLWVFDLG